MKIQYTYQSYIKCAMPYINRWVDMAGKEISMHRGQMGRRLPLKTVYYLSFLFFIVIPILIVLVVALFVLNKQFKNQALTNIRQAQ